jgi:hypothetical protein
MAEGNIRIERREPPPGQRAAKGINAVKGELAVDINNIIASNKMAMVSSKLYGILFIGIPEFMRKFTK